MQWLATVAKQLVSVYCGRPSSVVRFLRLPTDPPCDAARGGTAAYLPRRGDQLSGCLEFSKASDSLPSVLAAKPMSDGLDKQTVRWEGN